MEADREPRKAFETHMRQGTRPLIYSMARLAGGEYLSKFTEEAWREFKAGWNAAIEEYCI